MGRVWETLDSARKSKSEKRVSLAELLKNVEKSVVLLGQTVVACCYNRCLELLDTITRNFKESKSLLQTHDEDLRDPDLLFGPQFVDKIEKEEGKKHTDKGLFTLTPQASPIKKRQFSSPPSRHRQNYMEAGSRTEKRPFPGGSRQGENSYHGGFHGKSRGGNKHPRYVLLSKSPLHSTNASKSKQSKHSKQSKSHTILLSSINRTAPSSNSARPK